MNAKTYSVREGDIERRWFVVDATDETLGRLASRIAHVLEGKHKPTYSPHLDTGDHVVIVNAKKVKLTGRKEDQKIYRQHSGYEGGLREERARIVRQKQPARLVEEAVRGMLAGCVPRARNQRRVAGDARDRNDQPA